jgi:hypothetical protein
MGRLVITHSTYIEGLIPVLRKLALEPGIDTITPAVISRVQGAQPGHEVAHLGTDQGGVQADGPPGQQCPGGVRRHGVGSGSTPGTSGPLAPLTRVVGVARS